MSKWFLKEGKVEMGLKIQMASVNVGIGVYSISDSGTISNLEGRLG